MEISRETNQDQNPSIKLEQSPRKPPSSGGVGGGDRLKRDEWSEGAVSTLLEAYESKWVLRNRAKLKGQDWEDVARHVSSRGNDTKSPKTQTQCKNKIESMKKRYRSESATADVSSWPLFSRLDHLLRGSTAATSLHPPPPPAQAPLPAQPPPPDQLPIPPQLPPLAQPPQPAQPPPEAAIEIEEENSEETNGVDPMAKEDEEVGAKLSEHGSDKNQQQKQQQVDTDSSTPALYSNDGEGLKLKKTKTKTLKRKRRREDGSWEDIAESIRWLAEAVVRSEQARMDTVREVERMRVEAEAKRGELDLKRTEIIANTQLEIARLFASTVGKGVDSSLRIGRS